MSRLPPFAARKPQNRGDYRLNLEARDQIFPISSPRMQQRWRHKENGRWEPRLKIERTPRLSSTYISRNDLAWARWTVTSPRKPRLSCSFFTAMTSREHWQWRKSREHRFKSFHSLRRRKRDSYFKLFEGEERNVLLQNDFSREHLGLLYLMW